MRAMKAASMAGCEMRVADEELRARRQVADEGQELVQMHGNGVRRRFSAISSTYRIAASSKRKIA
jgi:hypothetical protein